MNISGLILKACGWGVSLTAPRRDKCVICVAPHTSNWDFILGLLAYKSAGRKANFLMKESWFFFPLKYLFRSLGGIPVTRKRRGDLTSILVSDFSRCDYMNLAITPEGTRSGKAEWHTGFIRIAGEANVPLQLGIIDYKHKRIIIDREFTPTGNIEADLNRIKEFYAPYAECARFPQKFQV